MNFTLKIQAAIHNGKDAYPPIPKIIDGLSTRRKQIDLRIEIKSINQDSSDPVDYKDADPKIAKKIILNAKLRNTAICGATETILLHEKIVNKIGNEILKNLENNGCKIIGDNKIRKNYNNKIKKAYIQDLSMEFLSTIV